MKIKTSRDHWTDRFLFGALMVCAIWWAINTFACSKNQPYEVDMYPNCHRHYYVLPDSSYSEWHNCEPS